MILCKSWNQRVVINFSGGRPNSWHAFVQRCCNVISEAVCKTSIERALVYCKTNSPHGQALYRDYLMFLFSTFHKILSQVHSRLLCFEQTLMIFWGLWCLLLANPVHWEHQLMWEYQRSEDTTLLPPLLSTGITLPKVVHILCKMSKQSWQVQRRKWKS